eukprot:scaffold184726_cov22-Tisochrysis_lutea.AAC.2
MDDCRVDWGSGQPKKPLLAEHAVKTLMECSRADSSDEVEGGCTTQAYLNVDRAQDTNRAELKQLEVLLSQVRCGPACRQALVKHPSKASGRDYRSPAQQKKGSVQCLGQPCAHHALYRHAYIAHH